MLLDPPFIAACTGDVTAVCPISGVNDKFGAARQLTICSCTLTVTCQGCDLVCGDQSEVWERCERLRGSKLC